MNILLTSVGRRSYLVQYFKEALGTKGEIHVANSSEISPAFSFADATVITPLIYDKDYIPFLLEYCRRYHIDVIISLFDVDLPVLSLHKEEFEKCGIRVIVSDKEVVAICNDKWLTYNFLKEKGFLCPKSYLQLDDVFRDIEAGIIKYPIILKPRWGMGSIGIMKAETQEELMVFYNVVKRRIAESYLKYESNEDLQHSVLIQEYFNAQEYGLDIINDLNGMYQTAVLKKKVAMRAGETDCAVTVDWSAGEEIAERLAKELKHVANLDVDVFEVDDKPYILEMNVRFGGGYPFSHLAGINLPKAIIDWCEGKETSYDNLTYQKGIMGHKDIAIVRLDKCIGIV